MTTPFDVDLIAPRLAVRHGERPPTTRRNRRELETVWQLAIASYPHALGEPDEEPRP